jgi:hypothetical protein
MVNYTCTHTAADFISQIFALWTAFTEWIMSVKRKMGVLTNGSTFKIYLIFITLKWHSQCMKFFARNILKELKIMGPHNLSNLNKKNLQLEQLMCIPLYAANLITFLPD